MAILVTNNILHLEGSCRGSAPTRVLIFHKRFLKFCAMLDIRYCLFGFKLVLMTLGIECITCLEQFSPPRILKFVVRLVPAVNLLRSGTVDVL